MSADNTGASDDFESNGCGGYGGDVFFTLHLTADALVTATMAPSDSTSYSIVSILQSCSATQELTCDVDTGSSTVTRNLTAGDYIIVADSYSGDEGPFTLDISAAAAIPPPANDSCTAPTTLPEGGTGLTGEAFGVAVNDYTVSSSATGCDGSTDSGADLVYSFTPSTSGPYQFTATETAGSATLHLNLIDGTCPASGTALTQCVAGSTSSPLRATLTAGQTYFLIVDTSSSDASSTVFNLSADVYTPPSGDLCSVAVDLGTLQAGTPATASGDTSDLDHDSAPSCNSSASGGDIYYSFTLSTEASVTATVTNTHYNGNVVSFLTACGGSELVCQSAFSSTTATATDLQPGTYVLFVSATSVYNEGTFSLSLTAGAPILPPTNDTCTAPKTLTEGAPITGETFLAAANDFDPSASGCTGEAETGPDLVYAFTPSTTGYYKIIATPDDTGEDDIGLYITDGTCPDASVSACVSGVDSNSGGEAETLTVSVTANTTYYVVVDSHSGAAGTFSLDAEPFTPTAGDVCGVAISLGTALDIGNSLTATGDTTDLSHESSSSCDGSGGDLYYSFTLTSESSVTASATSDDDYDYYVVSIIPACGGSELSCGVSDYYDPTAVATAKDLQPGTYYVVVSADSSYDEGTFSLEVTAAAPIMAPAGDVCSTAVVIDPATQLGVDIAGDTTNASNDLSFGSSGDACTGYSTSGNDVIYSFTPVDTGSYTVTATPTNFDINTYLLSSCDSSTGISACVVGADDHASGAESFTTTLTAGTTYFIVVDGYQSSSKGPFTLNVTKN